MSFIKNMLKGVTTAKTKEVNDDDEWVTSDLFEGGHRLSALDNIGSSLTTLWSNCALNKLESNNTEDDPNHKHIVGSMLLTKTLFFFRIYIIFPSFLTTLSRLAKS